MTKQIFSKIAAITILTAVVLGASSSLRAKSPVIDFDNGSDSTGTIETAREKGGLRHLLPRFLDLKPGLQPEELKLIEAPWPSPAPAVSDSSQDSLSLLQELPLPSRLPCEIYPVHEDDSGGETPSLCGNARKTSQNLMPSKGKRAVKTVGRYEQLITENEDYKKGLELKEQLGSVGEGIHFTNIHNTGVPAPVRNALLVQWQGIESSKGELLPDARALDAGEIDQRRFAVRLNTWYNRLITRKEEYESQYATFKRLCLGRGLPPDEYAQCKAFQDALYSCGTAHNQSAQAHSDLVALWRRNKECLETKGATLLEKIKKWAEELIQPWIKKAQRALQGDYDCAAIPPPSLANNNGIWALHCRYRCGSYTGTCGIARAFDHEPTVGEITAACPDLSKRPPVICPAPF
ncbi:MAG: hypothetical protein ABIJ96_17295 [Elusimicrobiota bacterium]